MCGKRFKTQSEKPQYETQSTPDVDHSPSYSWESPTDFNHQLLSQFESQSNQNMEYNIINIHNFHIFTLLITYHIYLIPNI